MKQLFILVILILLITPGVMAYDEVRTLGMSVEENAKLEVKAGAGFLDIEGVEGSKYIEVVAKVQIDHLKDEKKAKEYLEKALTLTLEKVGNKYVLTCQLTQQVSILSWLEKNQLTGRVNLFVKVPLHISLQVNDGSGDLQIRNTIGEVKLDDGSGHASIFNIYGKVKIEDGSGDLLIRNINGNVEIKDGSGEIVVVSIKGSVIIHDGSGSIKIDSVENDVTILEAGSGSVELKNILGRVEEH